jgi:hypothetical protein
MIHKFQQLLELWQSRDLATGKFFQEKKKKNEEI